MADNEGPKDRKIPRQLPLVTRACAGKGTMSLHGCLVLTSQAHSITSGCPERTKGSQEPGIL